MIEPVNLKTWLAGGSIFTAIQNVENFPFFADVPPAEMDEMLALHYGNRIVTTALVDYDINKVGKFIVNQLGGKWDALIGFNSLPANLGAEKSTKKAGSQNKVGVKDDVSSTENKVSAFNSDALITDTGASNTSEVNESEDLTKDETETVSSLKTAFNNLSLVERTNIITVVIKDVSSYITLTVYG